MLAKKAKLENFFNNILVQQLPTDPIKLSIKCVRFNLCNARQSYTNRTRTGKAFGADINHAFAESLVKPASRADPTSSGVLG